MANTYSSTSITTDVAKVRLLVGDTNSADWLMTDEEVSYFLSVDTDIRLVAARCCDAIRGKLARNVDRSNIQLSAQRSQVMQHYMDLAAILRTEARGDQSEGAVAYLAGSSIAERDTQRSDSSIVQAVFQRGMDDNNTSVLAETSTS
jgi:hypothetical protein